MQDQHSPRNSGQPESSRSRDDEIERVVLLKLLEEPQGGDHVRDVALDLNEDQADIEAAVSRLVDAGLATRDDDFVSPTKPAIRFHELWPISI